MVSVDNIGTTMLLVVIKLLVSVTVVPAAAMFKDPLGKLIVRKSDQSKYAQFDEIDDIYEIGPATTESLVNFFRDEKSKTLIAKLRAHGLKFMTEKNNSGSVNEYIKGKVFVLTGTLDKYSRAGASEIIEKFGGRVSSSVSKKTDYVLAGAEAGSKLDKANKLGVKIIYETDFENFF